MIRDYLWWTGQVVSLALTVALLTQGHGAAISACIGYALALLVDIRSALKGAAPGGA